MLNAIVGAVLRSPLHRLISGSLMLVTYVGRLSGRRYTIPVQYVQEGRRITVVPGRPETKTWWRNLVGGAPVALLVRGRSAAGWARALDDPPAVGAGIDAYLRRFPRASRWLHGPDDGPSSGRDVVVRIELVASEVELGGTRAS